MYQRLGKMPVEEVLKKLERNPALLKQVQASTGEDGKIHLSVSLAQRVDDFLDVQFYDDMNRTLIQQGTEKARQEADQAEGVARLLQFKNERGLADTQQNAKLIEDYLTEHFDGYLSEANVDEAVVALQTKLRWNIRPTNVKVWRPGDWLPDGATDAQLRTSSVEDVVAWKTRQGLLGRQ
jgi:hypothetical protein